jgi:hypothetical protein
MLAPPVVGDATIEIGSGKFRIEPDRSVEVGDRTIMLALVVIDSTASVVGQDIIRIEPDRGVEVGDREVITTLAVVDVATIGVGDCRRLTALPGRLDYRSTAFEPLFGRHPSR